MPDSSANFLPRLVVGLGNPGRKYENTRHNAGFMALDLAARRAGTQWNESSQWGAWIAKIGNTHLMKPALFMNCSGDAVQPYAAYFRIQPEEILVVLDEMALQPGRIRIRKTGSHGGHNGLASILDRFGSNAIPRIRIGIGSATITPKDYVLAPFTDEEWKFVSPAIDRSADAIETSINKGLDAAMNIFNTPLPLNPEEL